MTFRWVRSCLFFKCQENADAMDAKIRDYYKFQAALLEPWDGPALVCFTDGDGVGRVTFRDFFCCPTGKWLTANVFFCHDMKLPGEN